jgi:two-component system chemotaxis response regulator CheY
MKILVVEDQLLYREMFCQLLHMTFPQAQILVAEEGTTALSMTRMFSFDLIITDYQLGALSGGDVVRHLRQRAGSMNQPLPPIVVMSSQPEVKVFARSMGADGFLGKPVGEEDLRQMLAPLLANALTVGCRVTRDILPSMNPAQPGRMKSLNIDPEERRLWRVSTPA